jgi:hypothetical protein
VSRALRHLLWRVRLKSARAAGTDVASGDCGCHCGVLVAHSRIIAFQV